MEMQTRLTEVVVYPDRARLTRRGTVTLTPGLHQLEVGELSNRMTPDSARVSARGAARARLLGMQVQKAFYAETPAEQVRQLEEQIEAAQDQIAGIDGQIAMVASSRQHLDSLGGHTKIYAKALVSGQQKPAEQLALFDQLRQRSGELEAEALAAGKRRREAERRLQQLQQQLDQARSQRPRDRYNALIDVEILEAGDLQVELSYIVSGASWTPLYDLRLIENGQPAQLEVGYLAHVVQTSGETWEEVSLTLSTARPALAAAVPELSPWFIQPAPPPRPLPSPAPSAKMTMRISAPAGEPAQFDAMLGAEPPVAPAEEATARVDATGAAVSYAIPGKATVPPDGSAFKAVIARYALEPRLNYVTAPGMTPAAYRRVKVRNDSAYTLLPGKASLFAGDEFLGSMRLELTAPQAELEIYLGVDDRVHVERKLVRREVDKTIISGRRRLRYGYEIKLENLLSAPAELLVRDQIPVGRHEEIKTRLENAEPRPTKQTELNQLEWELTLAPQEKRTLRFDFAVEYPQAMEIAGLP